MRAAVDCREKDQGNVRVEIVVGNACGGKPSSHGSKAIVLQSQEPQEQTPVDDPYAEVEIKPQVKPRGSVAKEEDPKPPHQLYKLQIKFTRSTRQTLCCTEYIKGH